jgi:hypothetical protein
MMKQSSKCLDLHALSELAMTIGGTYLTFSILLILPTKSPFLASPSPLHANTRVKGTHVLKPLILLGFRG